MSLLASNKPSVQTLYIMNLTPEYWNTLASQFILISSLLAGFSITIVANLISNDNNNKMLSRILKLSVVSSGSFLVSLFAMVHIYMITVLDGYLEKVTEDNFALERLIGLVTFFLGLCSLSAILSLSGWVRSKSNGRFTTLIGVIMFILILILLIKKQS